MLFSFHKPFHELGARYKREQLFPCAAVASEIQGQLSVVSGSAGQSSEDRNPGVLCPRDGHCPEQLQGGRRLIQQVPLDLHGLALLFLPLPFPPVLSKGKRVHEPVLLLI